jgi:hypothetical protein
VSWHEDDPGPTDDEMREWYAERARSAANPLGRLAKMEEAMMMSLVSRIVNGQNPRSDGDKLRLLADWFDVVYPSMVHSSGGSPSESSDEGQNDLRRMAERLDRLDSMERPLRAEDIRMKGSE